MKSTLLPGLSAHKTIEVKPEHTTGHVARSVLATPEMIALIEWTCYEATAAHVDHGETTVGIHVCVSHESAVVPGETIDIQADLREVDGTKLLFDVEVTGPRGRVSTGTHRRAVLRLPS